MKATNSSDSVTIGGVNLKLSQPHQPTSQWIGQQEVLRQLLACWIVVDERDLPLAPRLVGPPGVGKTALGMAAAQARNQELYIYQCTSDTRPEDLLVTPVLSESGKIAYHASPLVTAMLRGGVCILDEGNRMNEKSWASLAPLLDQRRYVESIVAGITVPAHRDFRCCVTMNQDESTYEIPDYIQSRLQPTLQIGFPSKQDELAILRYHLPFAEIDMLAMTVEFLQHAHELKLDFSPRDGINLLRYALKRLAQDSRHPLGKDKAWQEAVLSCLGQEALDLESLAERRSRTLGGDAVPLGLGDFFFSPDDPLHPDRPRRDQLDELDRRLREEFEEEEAGLNDELDDDLDDDLTDDLEELDLPDDVLDDAIQQALDDDLDALDDSDRSPDAPPDQGAADGRTPPDRSGGPRGSRRPGRSGPKRPPNRSSDDAPDADDDGPLGGDDADGGDSDDPDDRRRPRGGRPGGRR